jgi:hypothetical protein
VADQENQSLTIESASRRIIENKLLTALSDGEHVAIIADKEDLEILVLGLHCVAGARAKELVRDMETLRQQAFGELEPMVVTAQNTQPSGLALPYDLMSALAETEDEIARRNKEN